MNKCAIFCMLLLAGAGGGAAFRVGGASACSVRQFELAPAGADFTGPWIVWSRKSATPVLVVYYRKGEKDGCELSLHPGSGVRITEQFYKQGLLDGPSRRYDEVTATPLLEGIFKNGVPWEGEFLENFDGDVIIDPSIAVSFFGDSLPAVRYREGRRYSVGDVGPRGYREIQILEEVKK